VTDSTDCDDLRWDVNPGAQERCDPDDLDEDCDGLSDDDDPSVTGTSVGFTDGDGDGVGDEACGTVASCELAAGCVSAGGDCDDDDASRSPRFIERCDPDDVDEDCDGNADDDDTFASGQTRWTRDLDGDGYGGTTALLSCEQPDGYVTTGGDCDDSDSDLNPGADEICNGIDDDCDRLVDTADTDLTDIPTWYRDADADGYGATSPTLSACFAPAGYADNSEDCNDGEATVNPDGTEVCNDGLDNDCDGGAPECELSGDYTVATRDLRIRGLVDNGEMGAALQAGDINGDGQADLIASEPGGRSDGGGLVWVFDGPFSTGATSPSAIDLAQLYGPAGAGLGEWLRLTSDLNGDGSQDLALQDANGENWIIESPFSGSMAVAATYDGMAGDGQQLIQLPGFAGDGQLAHAVSDPDTGSGSVDLWAGSSGVFATTTLLVEAVGSATGDQLGASLAGGDVSGDGLPDLFVGAPGAGAVYIIESGTTTTGAVDVASIASATIEADSSAAESAGLGISVAGLGDIDGDGLMDMGVASNGGNGAVWIITSPTNGLVTAVADLEIQGNAFNLGSGTLSVVRAANTNCNGDPDVLIGAPSANSDEGAVFLFHDVLGRADTDTSEADAAFYGQSAGDRFGQGLIHGDFDGDSCGDIAVGAPGMDATTNPDRGGIFIWYGQGW
jgi:hypothetical protein